MDFYPIKKIFRPAWFQGHGKTRNYFEGWYFKVVSADGRRALAFIPGISYGRDGGHAFIQAIDGMTGRTWYFRFGSEDFVASRREFRVRVADSGFSDRGFRLNIRDESGTFEGELSFRNPVTYPVTLARPGIMGWYRYVPFMECYHGVVSLDHALEGTLRINGETADFTGGKGYIEKDWGSSMPRAWIWMQTNHFETERTSFMLSIAHIPWLGGAFTGFLGFFLVEGRLYPFATYTRAKIRDLSVRGDKVAVRIQSRRFSISVEGKNTSRGALKAPVAGKMDRVIHECVDGELSVRMTDENNRTVFEGTGRHAGLELVGDMNLLMSD